MNCDKINRYPFGSVTVVKAVFTVFATSADVDPDVVSLTVKNNDGTTVYTYGGSGSPIVRTGVGLYQAELPLNVSGPWYCRFWSTGNGEGSSGDDYFEVRTSEAV